MITNPALGAFGNQNGVTFMGNLIQASIQALLVIGVVVFLFTFLLGAIQWITSGGDKAAAESAKHKLTQAVIGLVILLGFFAIVSALECFFGIGLRQISVGPFNVSLSGSAICR